MIDPLKSEASALTPKLAAPQHRPRPLPLFLEMLRRETADSPERMARALAGLRAYQEAPRDPPPALKPAIAEVQGATLRDYGGDGAPVLFVPSLINPPTILDLSAERSLLQWLAAQGHRVLLLDWGQASEARRGLSVAGHVEEIVLPMMRGIGEAPALVGYCLGGTMATAAAAVGGARSLATIAAPWHFAGFPDESRAMLGDLWARAVHATAAMGVLPMEILQSAFWSLDPARTVSKFEAFAGMDTGSAEARAFVTLEDWANDGPPVCEGAAREMFEDFFGDDVPGSGRWRVCGAAVDPARLPCPSLAIVSTTDRIVPLASAPAASETIALDQGHVGMVVGRHAKAALWEPLDRWLSRTPDE